VRGVEFGAQCLNLFRHGAIFALEAVEPFQNGGVAGRVLCGEDGGGRS